MNSTSSDLLLRFLLQKDTRTATVCNNDLAATGTIRMMECQSFLKFQVIFIYQLGKGLHYTEQKETKPKKVSHGSNKKNSSDLFFSDLQYMASF